MALTVARPGLAARVAIGSTLLLGAAVLLVVVLGLRLGPAAETEGVVDVSCVPGLVPASGQGRTLPEGFVLDALSPGAEALLLCTFGAPVDAATHPVLRVRLDDFPPNYVLLVGWRGDSEENSALARLQVPRGTTQTYYLPSNPSWRGDLRELALYLYPQAPAGTALSLDQPVTVRELRLEPDSPAARRQALGTSWSGVDPWNYRSLHSLGRHVDLLETVPLTPVLVGLWAVGGVLFALLFPCRGWRPLVARLAVLAIPLALVSQLHWLSSFGWQRAATAEIFGDTPPAERRLRLYDADLARLAARVREETSADQRIFVRAGDELTRFRLTWFLRPRNVLPQIPEPVWLQTGDRILLHDDAAGVSRALAGRFPRRADAVRVEILWQEGATALLAVR
ncbi:MAG: hypothetical protein AAGE01_01960 [Pseudomonadota bacterium]